jgi:serine/threonine-protein kinase
MHYDWRWSEAEKEFQRALALNPNYPTAHQWHAINLLITGHAEESIEELKKAQQLDPTSLILMADLAETYGYLNRDREAETEARQVLDLDPTFVLARYWLVRALVDEHRYKDAEASATQPGAIDNPYCIAAMGYSYASAGRLADARQVLTHLTRLAGQNYGLAFNIAGIYASMRDVPDMLLWLEKAFAERSGSLLLLNVAPEFELVRADPRFRSLLARIGLPSLGMRN